MYVGDNRHPKFASLETEFQFLPSLPQPRTKKLNCNNSALLGYTRTLWYLLKENAMRIVTAEEPAPVRVTEEEFDYMHDDSGKLYRTDPQGCCLEYVSVQLVDDDDNTLPGMRSSQCLSTNPNAMGCRRHQQLKQANALLWELCPMFPEGVIRVGGANSKPPLNDVLVSEPPSSNEELIALFEQGWEEEEV